MNNDTHFTPGPIVPLPFGCLAASVLEDGEVLSIVPLLGDRVRITLGPDLMYVRDGW